MKRILYIFFDQEEYQLFKRIKLNANADLKTWNLTNIFFPLITIIGTLIFYCFSDKSPSINSSAEKFFSNYLDFILNGALPLISINLLVASSFFLIKFDKNREKDLGLATGNLRSKLIIYTFSAYFLLSIFFGVQSIYSPFNNAFTGFVLLFLSIAGIYVCKQIADKLFLLQEDIIEKSYDEKMLDNVINLKNAIK